MIARIGRHKSGHYQTRMAAAPNERCHSEERGIFCAGVAIGRHKGGHYQIRVPHVSPHIAKRGEKPCA